MPVDLMAPPRSELNRAPAPVLHVLVHCASVAQPDGVCSHLGAPPVFQLQMYLVVDGVGAGVRVAAGVGGGVGVMGAAATALANAQLFCWSHPTLHVMSAPMPTPELRRDVTILTREDGSV